MGGMVLMCTAQVPALRLQPSRSAIQSASTAQQPAQGLQPPVQLRSAP